MGLSLYTRTMNTSYKSKGSLHSFPSSINLFRHFVQYHYNNCLTKLYRTSKPNTTIDLRIYNQAMSSRSAIHQKRPDHSRARSSSSQAHTLQHGYSPETEPEHQPNLFEEGPPLSDFTRGLPKRNRAPSGRRPSIPASAEVNGAGPRPRNPSLVERMRAAGSRQQSTSSYEKTNREAARKRGPSLVAKAKELMKQSYTNSNASSSSFRRLPDQLSRGDESAVENEKVRLSIEANTPCFCLIQRWKDPNDWLKPSSYWKKTHPAMNFRLWKVIVRNPQNHWKLKASAERNLEDATRHYEQKGGNSREWWPEDLEEEILDSWALGFGGQDPPRRKWTLEE